MTNAILTIHDIYNYGSVLQAYASQRVIQQFGTETHLIDYVHPQAEKPSIGTLFPKLVRSIQSGANGFLKDCLPGKPYTTYKHRYDSAKKDWYNLTKRYADRDSLVKDPPTATAFISGSDQVWHPRTAGKDFSFLLDFVPKEAKRFSFASSFGVRDIGGIPQHLVRDYARLLDQFDHITVRERSGVQLVKELCGRHAELVVDPTLLLSGADWLSEAGAPLIEGDYILAYGISPHRDFMPKVAFELSRHTGWPIVFLNGTFLDVFRSGRRHILNAGPREFLSLLSRARVILGQSFHATAFAVNFGVPFYSLLRGESNHDSRQRDFLAEIGLEGRCIQPEDDVEAFLKSVEAVDFKLSSQRLNELRCASAKTISRMIAP